MISVLRLGHRIFRDQRLSSHVFLAARALGASAGFYTGQKDQGLESSIKKASESWGGDFQVKYLESWKPFLKNFRGLKIHLTVYGLPFQEKIKSIGKSRNILIIVGGEKVPPEIYQVSDHNLSVGLQPHSEVSALGIFLYELAGRRFQGFKASRLKVVPQEKGKQVIRKENK